MRGDKSTPKDRTCRIKDRTFSEYLDFVHVLHEAYQKQRALFLLWVAFVLAAIVMLIIGSTEISRVAYFEQQRVDLYNSIVTWYSTTGTPSATPLTTDSSPNIASMPYNYTDIETALGGFTAFALSNFYLQTSINQNVTFAPMQLNLNNATPHFNSHNYVDNSYSGKILPITSQASSQYTGQVFPAILPPQIKINQESSGKSFSISTATAFSIMGYGYLPLPTSSAINNDINNNHVNSPSNNAFSSHRIPLWTYEEVSENSDSCQSHQGYYIPQNSSCLRFYRIQNACLSLKLSPTGNSTEIPWILNDGKSSNIADLVGSNYGCKYPFNLAVHDNVASYTPWAFDPQWIITNNQSENASTVVFNDISIEFRSFNDPYTILSLLTNGTNQFYTSRIAEIDGNPFGNKGLGQPFHVLRDHSLLKLGIGAIFLGAAFIVYIVTAVIQPPQPRLRGPVANLRRSALLRQSLFLEQLEKDPNAVKQEVPNSSESSTGSYNSNRSYTNSSSSWNNSLQIQDRVHQQNSRMSILLLFSLLCGAIIFGIGRALIGHWSSEPYFSRSAFSGVIILLFALPLFLTSLYGYSSNAIFLANSSLNFINTPLENAKHLFGVFASAALSVTFCILSLIFFVHPHGEPGLGLHDADYLRRFFGIFSLIAALPWTVFYVYSFVRFAWKLLRQQDIQHELKSHNDSIRRRESVHMNGQIEILSDDEDVVPGSIQERKRLLDVESNSNNTSFFGSPKNSPRNSRSSIRQRISQWPLLTIFITVFWMPFLVIVSMIFPPIWNVSWPVYKATDSPFSLIHNVRVWALGNASSRLYVKLFDDILGYYLYLYLIILFSLAARYSQRVRRILHRRVGKSFCVGELVLFASLLVFTGWWIWFWGSHYTRISTLTIQERLARLSGHVGNLCFSFLLMPITRNSMWEQLYGVPFDRTIQFHRWLGYITVGSWFLHFLAWCWFFVNQGKHAVILNFVSLYMNPHADNWTVPMMFWVVLVGSIIMLILAQDYFRRRHFELFYYSHHFYLVIIIATLIHAWGLWLYLLPPVSFYIFDRILRFAAGATAVKVVTLEYHPSGHTRLELQIPPNWKTWRAGQYIFLNVPAISHFQWHPFSISSAPPNEEESNPTLVFYIKNMGSTTWTGQLAEVAMSAVRQDVLVRVDGPYGNPSLNPQDFRQLLLIGGGVGVTPMHSILMDLFERMSQSDPTLSKVQKVYFIWTVREVEAIHMIGDSLARIQNSFLADHFKIIIKVTSPLTELQQMENLEELFPFNVTAGGRIDMEKWFVEASYGQPPMQTACFVCGPEGLVTQASALSSKYDVNFHEEIFAF